MEKRFELYRQMICELDEAYRLINEYDSLQHNYGSATMYQAESQVIHCIGEHPNITASGLAVILKKTTSACSQLVKKLRQKGWVVQTRNEKNNREYHLTLSPAGEVIYQEHSAFESRCYLRTFQGLEEFSEEEFASYIAIQRKMNESFVLDVEESRQDSLP